MKAEDIKNLRREQRELYAKSVKDSSKFSADDRFRLTWLNETLERYQNQAEYVRMYLGKRFVDRTFKTFNEDENEQAKRMCQDYVVNYRTSKRNSLLLVGSYGTGKTHLAAAIANEIIDDGIPIMFDTFTGYLNKLKKEFDGNVRYCLKNMKETPVLFIDDIGKEKQTDWTQSIMFDVINTRYEEMLPTVITSNISGKELENYLGRATYSRLCEMCIPVKVKGSDYRKKGDDALSM